MLCYLLNQNNPCITGFYMAVLQPIVLIFIDSDLASSANKAAGSFTLFGKKGCTNKAKQSRHIRFNGQARWFTRQCPTMVILSSPRIAKTVKPQIQQRCGLWWFSSLSKVIYIQKKQHQSKT